MQWNDQRPVIKSWKQARFEHSESTPVIHKTMSFPSRAWRWLQEALSAQWVSISKDQEPGEFSHGGEESFWIQWDCHVLSFFDIFFWRHKGLAIYYDMWRYDEICGCAWKWLVHPWYVVALVVATDPASGWNSDSVHIECVSTSKDIGKP